MMRPVSFWIWFLPVALPFSSNWIWIAEHRVRERKFARPRDRRLIAVLVDEIDHVGRERRLARRRGVGVERCHLLHEHRGGARLGGDIGRELRIGWRDHLAGPVHAPQHLHVDVDVRVCLDQDHAPAPAILELAARVQRDARSARPVEECSRRASRR
jgi:hypothetical protein